MIRRINIKSVTKRIISAFLCTCMSAVVLCGCGESGENSQDTSSSSMGQQVQESGQDESSEYGAENVGEDKTTVATRPEYISLVTKMTEYSYGEISYVYTYEYNDANKVTKCIVTDKDGNIENVITYEYDDKQNLLREEKKDGKDERLNMYVYEYDETGKLVKYQEYLTENTPYKIVEYDGNGNITKEETYLSADSYMANQYKYDDKNREIECKFTSTTSKGESVYTTTYDDEKHQATKVFNYSDGRTALERYTYDEAGNELTMYVYDSLEDDEYNSGYEYEYDKNGNKIKWTRYSNFEVIWFMYEYEYNDSGKKIKEVEYKTKGEYYATNTYTYDEYGDLTSLVKDATDGMYALHYTYDEKGGRTSETYVVKKNGGVEKEVSKKIYENKYIMVEK